MSSELRPTLVLAMLALPVLACADLQRGPAPAVPEAGPDVTAGDGGGIAFATVRPLLDDGCRHCHAAGQQAGDTGLLLNGDAAAEYSAVRSFVDPGAPAGSRLLSKASGQGHGGGTIYRVATPEYAALLAWIESGAGP